MNGKVVNKINPNGKYFIIHRVGRFALIQINALITRLKR